MTKYIVTPSGTEAKRMYGFLPLLYLRAKTIESAAQNAARRLYGRRACALRQTGTPGGSGVWALYVPTKDGYAWTGVGGNVHIRKE